MLRDARGSGGARTTQSAIGGAGDDQRQPAALAELLEHGDDEDAGAQERADDVDGDLAPPARAAWRGARHQKRVMPTFESEKVTKTLIEYMTTSASTLPRV